jgi:hypothetical protein
MTKLGLLALLLAAAFPAGSRADHMVLTAPDGDRSSGRAKPAAATEKHASRRKFVELWYDPPTSGRRRPGSGTTRSSRSRTWTATATRC